ncbi:MAG: FAD-dependent oxidoreductase, partial [Acidimicrobiaceae bacterium]|nr:FAD-dependent oxidoreductase [Acidimicrobiaceae bacterium]
MASDVTVVVGGGIVGLACAYELASGGHAVHVLDRSTIGTGSSAGNAGWVTLSQCYPVPSPDSVRTALRSVGRAESPLYVRPSLSPAFLRWLYEFRRFCDRPSFTRGATVLARLAEDAVEHYEKWQRDGIDTTLTRPGLVHAFLDEDEAHRTLALQRSIAGHRFTVPERPLSGHEILELEPSLRGWGVRSAYLVEDESLVNPLSLVGSLSERLRALDVEIAEHCSVSGFLVEGRQVRTVIANGEPLDCARVVVASGAWSAEVLARLGVPLRMQTGKGYSFSVHLPTPPQRPLYLGDRHVAVSPLGSATRIAGTMEFSGNNLRLDWRRVEAIAQASRHYLGDWFENDDELIGLIGHPWVGGRPMVPDGLPLIDRVPGL